MCNGNNGLVAFPGIFGRSRYRPFLFIINIIIAHSPQADASTAISENTFTSNLRRPVVTVRARSSKPRAVRPCRAHSVCRSRFLFIRPGRLLNFLVDDSRRMRTTSSGGRRGQLFLLLPLGRVFSFIPPAPHRRHFRGRPSTPPDGFTRNALGPVRRRVFIFN